MNCEFSFDQDFNLVKQIADRMRDPHALKELISAPINRNPNPILARQPYWRDLSTTRGYPGILPLFTELDRLSPDEGWDAVCHDYIVQIKESLESQEMNILSIFGGISGICFYLKQASRQGTRYLKMLSKLDIYLECGLRRVYLEPMNELLRQSRSIPAHYYECIQGLSGIGVYVLNNSARPLFRQLLEEILVLLINITNRSIEFDGKKIPGWHVPIESLFFDTERVKYPKGNFNLGLSHGIPGVLAFLSIAMMDGIVLKGQREAIEKITSWLKDRRRNTTYRFYWPTSISFEEEVSNCEENSCKSRDAWCYGTPGVARSLYLAATALRDQNLKSFALASFLSVFQSDDKDWGIPCSTFCHGLSGLLMITHLMAKDSHLPELKEKVSELRNLLISRCSLDAPLGFKTLAPMHDRQGFIPINRADILEGVSGVLLTLLALHRKGYSWHLPFLIDGGVNNAF